MAILGLADEHLRDAMAEVAGHLLAMGEYGHKLNHCSGLIPTW